MLAFVYEHKNSKMLIINMRYFVRTSCQCLRESYSSHCVRVKKKKNDTLVVLKCTEVFLQCRCSSDTQNLNINLNCDSHTHPKTSVHFNVENTFMYQLRGGFTLSSACMIPVKNER